LLPDRLDLATATEIVKPRRARSVVRLTGGGNSAVFEIACADGTAVIVKVYSDPLHWKLEKEVFVYDLLRRNAVASVPTVLAADDSKTLLPQNILVLTKLQGEHVLSILDQLDDDELATINRQIGALLRVLHDVRFEAFGYVNGIGVVSGHATNLDYMRFQFAKKLGEFETFGGDAALADAIARHVAAREELLAACTEPSFCHNDCHYGNVLVRDGRVSGLLDFENVLAGDPLLDLAKAHCYSRRRSEATLAALVDEYGELPERWREALDLYVLYHWLELWDWYASLGHDEPLPELEAELRALVRPAK
jgi:hygromycin-B 7''-O-kinase